jgi:hypothetical protein
MFGLQDEHEGGEECAGFDSECASAVGRCCADGSSCCQRVRAGREGVYVRGLWSRQWCADSFIVSTHDEERVHGPMAEYDARVESGRLRDDEHQRSRTRHERRKEIC